MNSGGRQNTNSAPSTKGSSSKLLSRSLKEDLGNSDEILSILMDVHSATPFWNSCLSTSIPLYQNENIPNYLLTSY
jgi:hypothetical protein